MIFYNHLILVPWIAFVISVFIKAFVSIVKEWKINVSKALGSWWMPSAHTAVSVSLTTAIAIKYWIWSDLFAMAMSFTIIIVYDAINVRFEAWLHASALNKYIWENKFKERLWHLPSEAFAWAVLGILVAIWLYYI